MDDASLIRRKKIILWCAIILSYFTSMSKVLVPGFFSDPLLALGFGAGAVWALGTGYMCTYSFSQLTVGVFSDRWGGVRLLLFGGSFFVAGSLLFSLFTWFPCYPLLFAARVITGMGAGTVFLGLTKLIGDLYPERFGMIFGVAMFLGYLGPICGGGTPMVWLIRQLGWRWALFIPALLAAVTMTVLAAMSHGAVKPVMPGNSMAALRKVLSPVRNWMLFGASAMVFGAYYVLLTGVGQKCLKDNYHMDQLQASLLITGMAVLVALLNPGTNLILKFCGGRRRLPMFIAALFGVAGALLGFVSFQWKLPLSYTVAAFILMAIPAGLFSHYSLVMKEMNSLDLVGLAISMLNFFAFVMITVSGQIAGALLGRHTPVGQNAEGAPIFPGETYRDIFIFLIVLELIGLACCFGVPETRPKRDE